MRISGQSSTTSMPISPSKSVLWNEPRRPTPRPAVTGPPIPSSRSSTACDYAEPIPAHHPANPSAPSHPVAGGPAVPHNPRFRRMGVAQRMADGGVLAIRGPAIVDQDAAQVLDNAHCVHGGGAPLLVEVVEREFGGRGRVHPVQRGLDSKTGLVGVDDISACKLVSKRSEEGIEPRCPFLDHGHDRPGRYRYPIAVRHQFGDPLDRNVLADHQVTHQRSEIRAVAGWTGGLGGKRCTRLISAVTPAALRSMLDGPHFDWREVEHLAPDLPSDRCVAEIVSASLTAVRCVVDDLVGIGDRGEILAWSTGSVSYTHLTL